MSVDMAGVFLRMMPQPQVFASTADCIYNHFNVTKKTCLAVGDFCYTESCMIETQLLWTVLCGQ